MKKQQFLITVFCILVVTAQIAEASTEGKQKSAKSSIFDKIVDVVFDVIGLPKQLSSIKDVIKLASAGLLIYTTYSDFSEKNDKKES